MSVYNAFLLAFQQQLVERTCLPTTSSTNDAITPGAETLQKLKHDVKGHNLMIWRQLPLARLTLNHNWRQRIARIVKYNIDSHSRHWDRSVAR